MRTTFGLEGKRFMIVGGGLGMGEATARLLASLGCHLAIVDLDRERADRVAQDICAAGGTAIPAVADVTAESETVAEIARIERELGPLDGMATIVGMAAWSSIVDMSLETWELDHRRNLRQFFITGRAVARSLLDRGSPGSLVCVASVDGLRSAPNHASYGAAKAGLVSLVKTMAVEWSGKGIRVNAVAPGGVVTPRIPLGDEASERRAMHFVPMQRRGTVDEIANVIAFFLSELSSYVTGQTLAVDGGYTASGVFGLPPSE